MRQRVLRILIFAIYSIVLLLIGFSIGDIRGNMTNMNKRVIALESLLKVQGDSPESIKTNIDYMKMEWINEYSGAKRQLLSIWLPSILVMVNIILTIIFKNIK